MVLPKADVQKLYIKLDKKLIVKIDYLKIKKDYSETDIKSQLLSVKNYLKYFDLLFKELNIKKIEYENNTLSLRYKKNLFFLETDQLYLLSNISLSNKNLLIADIKKLYIKPYRASFIGHLKANPIDKKYEFDGTFFTHNINGKAKLTLERNMFQYYLYDIKSSNIAPFMDYLNEKIYINKIISNWIYKYIVAKKYNLKYLFGKIDIKTGEFYPRFMRGEAIAEDAKVEFHKDLPKVKIKKIAVSLKNDSLIFHLKEPSYEDINLTGSSVKITNLLTKGAYIEINIKAKHYIDDKVKKILKAFDITLPLSQKVSKTSADLKLTIPFVPFSIDVKGHFVTKNSILLFNNIKFETKYANVFLHNNTITIKNSNLSYKNIFDINTTGTFNAKKRVYSGDIDINKLSIKYKDETLLNAKNMQDKIRVDFKKGAISIPRIEAYMRFQDKNSNFSFNDLKKIYPISPLLKKYDISNGKINIYTNHFKSYKLSANIDQKQNILLSNGKPIKEFDITAKIDKNGIFAKTTNDLIELNITNKIDVSTKDISFNLKEKTNNTKKDINSNSTKPLTLRAKNSTIYLQGGLSIPTDQFSFFTNRDKMIFSSIYKDNHIFYSKDAKIVDINTNFITSRYLNTLINHDLFHGGAFKFYIQGKNDIFKGRCDIVNTVIKSVKKGGQNFKIDNGKFDFYYINDILTLQNINLRNNFSTLVGNGYIDLKNRKLNLTFNVTILKQLGKTIKSIPFLGYILLGKNGKFTSKAKIFGSFDNPVIKTDFAENAIKSPFNIIFRIIKTPFRLFSPSK